MANNRAADRPIRMTLLKQIIALKQKGLSHRSISRQLGISRKTANKYVRLWQENGSLPIEEEDVSSLLLPPPGASGQVAERHAPLYDFFPYVEKELQRTGVTGPRRLVSYFGKNTNEKISPGSATPVSVFTSGDGSKSSRSPCIWNTKRGTN